MRVRVAAWGTAMRSARVRARVRARARARARARVRVIDLRLCERGLGQRERRTDRAERELLARVLERRRLAAHPQLAL